jgi:hypothetical protein
MGISLDNSPKRGRTEKGNPIVHQVSERALVQRIKRVLARDSIALRKPRPDSLMRGPYYLKFPRRVNGRQISDIEELGRDLGVLEDYEQLAMEGKS